MPRTLPWLKAPPSTPAYKDNHPTPPTTRPGDSDSRLKRRRIDEPATPTSARRTRKAHSPSTPTHPRTTAPTPPTPHAPTPPSPPRPTDGAWAMVEDEFLATAQLFTAHLHRAEYRRLQARAAARAGGDMNAGGLKGVSGGRVRGGVGADMLSGVGDGEGVGDEVVIPDRSLAGLMLRREGTIRSRTKLEGLVAPAKSRTRAAAGFGKQDAATKRFPRRETPVRGPEIVQERDRGEEMEESTSGGDSRLRSVAEANEFPFARRTLIQRKAQTTKAEERGEGAEDEKVVPTFLY